MKIEEAESRKAVDRGSTIVKLQEDQLAPVKAGKMDVYDPRVGRRKEEAGAWLGERHLIFSVLREPRELGPSDRKSWLRSIQEHQRHGHVSTASCH